MGFRPPQTPTTATTNVGEQLLSPMKSEFEGGREVPVLLPGSQTPMRIMMRGGDVRGISISRPISSDGPIRRIKRDTDRSREI